MTKTVCDYCGKKIEEPFNDFRGDLDRKNLAVIAVKPKLLNRTVDVIHDPDLCRECIIKTLRG